MQHAVIKCWVTKEATMGTAYVLGAGASFHAGYPLCSQLWPQMVAWVVGSQPSDSAFSQAVGLVTDLVGPVPDVEAMFTDLDLNRGAFQHLSTPDCDRLRGSIRSCLREYLKSIQPTPSLYVAFADRLVNDDTIITFNYDVSLENALASKQLFRVKDGYGFEADWDEPASPVTVLKLHGSMNWIGLLFGGSRSSGFFANSLGARPFVDNIDSVLSSYPSEVLDKSFREGGVLGPDATMILPTHEKKFSISTSIGDEWVEFFESLWARATECLSTDDQIVVIGYSMPKADQRARTMILGNANKNAEVLLCCASSNPALKQEFEKEGFLRVRAIGDFGDFLEMRDA